MGIQFSLWGLVLRRTLDQGKLLVSISLGVCLTTVVLAGVPLYINAISDLGIKQELNKHSLIGLDIQIYSPLRPLSQQDYQQAAQAVEEGTKFHLGWLVRDKISNIKSSLSQFSNFLD